MKINVTNESGEHICYVEVSPSDTIWTLKCKLHREYLGRASWGEPSEGEPSEGEPSVVESSCGYGIIPPVDDQSLYVLPNERELSQCDNTMEFYDLHEGSKVRCMPKSRSPQEMHFRKCVDVFRKVERNTLSFQRKVTSGMTVCVYHACCHMHEVTVLDLQYGDIGDEGAIRIAEGLDKNTSLIRLDLGRVFAPPSFFIHCWICHSFIS